MLNLVDLSARCKKSEFEAKIDEYYTKMGALQRKLREEKVPVILVIEGWHGSLRGSFINKFIAGLDPRGYLVCAAPRKTHIQHGKPYFTSFWDELPVKGSIRIYDNSWYYGKIEDEVEKQDGKDRVSYGDINFFEKELTDDGYLLIKVFLHISHQRQKKNLEKVEKIMGDGWEKLLAFEDKPDSYDRYYKEYEEMLGKTDKSNARWHVLSADDSNYALLQLFEVMFMESEEYFTRRSIPLREDHILVSPAVPDILSKVDLTLTVEDKVYKKEIKEKQRRLRELEYELYRNKIGAAILFEGWDAAGKGGAIKRLTKCLYPLIYRVVPIAAPNMIEQQFHYLWRFWRHMPLRGELVIFDRTWYGRVMVERVEGFAKPTEWERAYEEINVLEKQWTDNDIVIVKFWLHIDSDEQMKRFKEREANPDKKWKITDEDWRNRSKWDDYSAAINEMIFRTNSRYAPWTIVEANSKQYARLKVLTTVVEAFEAALKKKNSATD